MDDNTKNLIQNHIDTNEVCLFMKGTPDAPQCGFSMAVSNMLKILEVNFQGVNVLEDQNLREGIKVFSDWPTIPQLILIKNLLVVVISLKKCTKILEKELKFYRQVTGLLLNSSNQLYILKKNLFS